jgi:hypothetical protein
MRKQIIHVFILALICISLTGCFTHKHTVGSGSHSGQKEVYHQWYALWGGITIGDEKDGGQIAGTTNCTITTKFTALDVLINMFTSLGTINRRTIIIEK